MTLERAVIVENFSRTLRESGFHSIADMLCELKDKIIDLEAANEELKEQYDFVSEKYTELMDDYSRFVERINKEN